MLLYTFLYLGRLELFAGTNTVGHWFSKCGPWIIISLTWKFLEIQSLKYYITLDWALGPTVCSLSLPGDSDAGHSLRTAALHGVPVSLSQYSSLLPTAVSLLPTRINSSLPIYKVYLLHGKVYF